MGRVCLLGVRGSVPVCGVDHCRYGGATTCVLIQLGNECIVLDAGTGILNLPAVLPPDTKHLSLLLTHSHIDHIQGLPMCNALFDPSLSLDIYAAPRGGMNVQKQLERQFSPPLWPVRLQELQAQIRFFDLPEELSLGDVRIRAMEGVHPGGVSLLRLEGDGKRVAFITDCTLQGSMLSAAADFARDCDLLLCDGQYSDAQWPTRRLFGHSTWQMASELSRLCRARETHIIHHDPSRTDDALDAAAAELAPCCTFAYDGEVICL